MGGFVPVVRVQRLALLKKLFGVFGHGQLPDQGVEQVYAHRTLFRRLPELAVQLFPELRVALPELFGAKHLAVAVPLPQQVFEALIVGAQELQLHADDKGVQAQRKLRVPSRYPQIFQQQVKLADLPEIAAGRSFFQIRGVKLEAQLQLFGLFLRVFSFQGDAQAQVVDKLLHRHGQVFVRVVQRAVVPLF